MAGILARRPAGWLACCAAAAMLVLSSLAAADAVTFPALSGRVVDQANILSAQARTSLETKLADLEAKSGIQLVVATVSSLEGQEIEPYAVDLFRTWKLGEATKNNGALLLVAPNDRRVRIEVGYGLEGTLTDALSKVIITNAIAPRFKAGDFSDGVTRGVDDIITVLTTDASEWQKKPSLRLDKPDDTQAPDWLVMALVIGFIVLFLGSRGFRWFVLNMLLSMSFNSGNSRGGFSGGGGGWGGGGGGGFSGGGGSSGGGGASGSW